MIHHSQPRNRHDFFRSNHGAANYLKIFWIFSSFSVIILFGFQILQVNALTREIFTVENLREKIELLEKENKILGTSSSQTNSLKKIERKLQELGFERVNKTKYFRILEGSVVRY